MNDEYDNDNSEEDYDEYEEEEEGEEKGEEETVNEVDEQPRQPGEPPSRWGPGATALLEKKINENKIRTTNLTTDYINHISVKQFPKYHIEGTGGQPHPTIIKRFRRVFKNLGLAAELVGARRQEGGKCLEPLCVISPSYVHHANSFSCFESFLIVKHQDMPPRVAAGRGRGRGGARAGAGARLMFAARGTCTPRP